MGAYLNKAREFHRQAITEFDEWKRTRSNDVLIRDAAEKGWGAVTQAANEIIAAFGGGHELPTGSTGRHTILRDLERTQRELRALRFAARHNDALTVLHGRAFYDGDYRPAVVEEYLTQEVKDYLDDVERVTARSPRS